MQVLLLLLSLLFIGQTFFPFLSHKGLFPRLIKRLHESGFLTDDLVRDEINGNQRKYMGVCRLKLPAEKSSQCKAVMRKNSNDDGGIPLSLEPGAQACDSTSSEVSSASKPSRIVCSSTEFDAATGFSITSMAPTASSSTVSAAFDDALASSTTSGVHRRIDLIVVPFHEWACARLYFTGRCGEP